MATLKIDGKEITVKDNTLILDAAKEAGVEIPTFCYQAGLSGVGSCRMCIIEIGGQKKLQPACITPVMNGMEVFTESPQVVSARASMLEFLLSNHALDCPVCDKAGECELQDLVFKHGPRKGNFKENKRTFHNKDYALSPVIVKNSNRCVQCTRCVRACREIVGRGVLGVIGRGAGQEMTSFLKSELDCDHCGMCIEVCPCGCFMRRPYRYTARPWDLKSAKTVCPYCATGCRITVQERAGTVVRSIARDGEGFNDRMLCARGRFGFDFVNSEHRLTTPLLKKEGAHVPISWEEAFDIIKDKFGKANPERMGGIASARLTNEELYQFQKMMREVYNCNNIDSTSRWSANITSAFIEAVGITDGAMTIHGCMHGDLIFVIGSQVSDENPVTDYIVRYDSATRRKGLIIASPRGMKLDRSAQIVLRHSPTRLGALLLAVASALYTESPDRFSAVAGIEALKNDTFDTFTTASGVSGDDIKTAAKRLKAVEGISIMAGTDMLRYGDGIAALTLLKNMLKVLGKNVRTMPLLDRSNQRGAWDMGVHPHFGPGYAAPREKGLGALALMEKAVREGLDALYVVGEDLITKFPDRMLVERALLGTKFIVVQDIFLSETAKMADLVLPGTAFTEKDGTTTNQEGRAQRINPLKKPLTGQWSGFDVITAVGSSVKANVLKQTPKEVFAEICGSIPSYAGADADVNSTSGFMVKPFTGASLAGVPPKDEKTALSADAKFPYLLVTGNHMFFSGSLSARSSTIDRLVKDPTIEIAASEAEKMGLSDGDYVVVVSSAGVQAKFALKTNLRSRKDVVFIPENFTGNPVNKFFRMGDGLPRVSVAPFRKG